MSLHHRMMLQRYGLGHTTSLYSTVLFDPIFTPLFLSIGFTGSITIGTATITTASIASAIATTALTFGLQMLMAPKPPKPEDGKAPKTQSIPYRAWCVGTNRLSGAYMLWESKGKNLYAVQAIAGHKVSSVNRFWLHDDEVTLDVDGKTDNAEDGRYWNKVRILYNLGLAVETPYSFIVDDLSAEGIWTNDHLGNGQASLAMIARASPPESQAERFPYGVPNLSAEVDGAHCWDFRDPAQDPEDPSTWEFTKNCAVILAWHLCFSEFGEGLDYTKAILPVIELWQEEADICDEDVPLYGGGFEKRYECNGWDTTENSPKVGINAILAACDGHLVARGDGARILTVGKFRESRCGTLSDADIIGHSIQYDVLFEDEINRLIPKFTYPAIDYATADTDFFEDTDAQLSARRVLAEEAEYTWVHQWRQARRLAKREWLRIQQKINGSIDVRFSGINSVYHRWNRLTTPHCLPRLNGKVVENRRSILALTKGGFSMDIKQHPENIDDWTPSEDEGQQPPVPAKPNADGVVTPVINLVQAKPNASSVYIRVVIVDPEDDSLTAVVRYRLVDNGTGNPGAWIEQEFPDAEPGVPMAGYVELNTGVVPSDEDLEIQVAFKSSRGKGDWSVSTNVTSTVDPIAPAALVSFTQTAAAPHLGSAIFSLTTPNDSHLRTVKLYRKATGSGIDPDVDAPIATLTTAASATYGYTDGDVSTSNLVTNGDFASSTGWTLGTGWSIASGIGTKAASASTSRLSQAIASMTDGKTYRGFFALSGFSAGSVRMQLTGGTNSSGALRFANGAYLDSILSVTGNNTFCFAADPAFVGSVDNVTFFEETLTSAPQGVWDYYAVPFNGSNVDGPPSGPITVTIV